MFITQGNYYISVVFSLLLDKPAESYQAVLHQCACAPLVSNVKTAYSILSEQFTTLYRLLGHWWKLVCVDFTRASHGGERYKNLCYRKKFEEVNSETGRLLKKVLGLSMLFPSQIEDCFAFDLFELKPAEKAITKIFDYICDNYFDYFNPPPSMEVNFLNTKSCTMNCCESFHTKCNAEFTTTHP